MSKIYIPNKGDIIWTDFNPQAGKEIAKRRPVLVLSPKEYNKTGLMLAVPITSKVKGYPFEVEIKDSKIDGVILSDAIKSLDWKIRNTKFISSISNAKLIEVLQYLSLLLKP